MAVICSHITISLLWDNMA